MDSKHQNNIEDDNGLVFQSLTPEEPANAFQKSIIRMQQNGNKRYLLIFLAVLSSLLIFFLVFQTIRTYQQNNPTHSAQAQITLTTTNVAQMIAYHNVIYTLTNQPPNPISKLDALDAQTGKLVWSYAHHNTEGIKLVGDILYLQTDTHLVALNANTRATLWQNQILSSPDFWQVDQGILFAPTTDGLIAAFNATTGVQLWQTKQQSGFWQVNDGIFYTAPLSGPGLSALDARSGQQLWYSRDLYQGLAIAKASINQDLAITNGNIYLQNSDNQNIQAFDGKTGKVLWQLNTHRTDLMLSASNDSILLSNINKIQVEALDSKTGKVLWQHPGTISTFIEGANQTAILSAQNNRTDIIRTSDGTTLYHIASADVLLSIANNIALFVHYPTTDSNGNTSLIVNIEAINISDGATIWSQQSLDKMPVQQNNIIEIVSISNNSLLALRADNGQTLWQHTFDTISK